MALKLNRKFGLFNKEGKENISMKYGRIDSFKDKIAYAEAGKDSFYLYQDDT